MIKLSSPAFLLVIICLFSKLSSDRGGVEALDLLQINKISLLEDLKIAISFEDTQGSAETTSIFTLFIGDPEDVDIEHMKPYSTSDAFTETTDEQTMSFDYTGALEFSNKNIIFILIGETNKVQIVEGSIQLQFNKYPSTAIKSKIVGGDSLRIKDDLHGWEICIDEATSNKVTLYCKDDSSAPCYALGIGATASDGKRYSICSSITDPYASTVFVKAIEVAEATDSTPSPTNITLEYVPSATPPSPPDSAIMYVGSNIVAGNGEAVFHDDGYNLVKICDSLDTCNISPFTPSDNSYNIILVEKNTMGQAKGSVVNTFQDSELNVLKLEDQILEARWIFHKEQYTAKLTTVTGDDDLPPYHTVHADCVTHPSGFCYAYYVNVDTTATYTVAVTPNIDPTTDGLNQITSALFDMTKIKSTSTVDNLMNTIVIDTQYKEGSGNLELNICYSYDLEHKLENKQLEVVLISPSRQWRRILENDMQKSEQKQCYLNTYDLDSDEDLETALTALIIQRNITSGNILSYHRRDLNQEVPRAIKPDIDSGSNGSTSTIAIIGAAIAGIACLVALVAAAFVFVMKAKRDNDGLQYPLHRRKIEDSGIIRGIENPVPTI